MLTQAQAEQRASLVRPSMEYELYLYLPSEGPYHGLMRCSFRMRAQAEVFLDFAGSAVTAVTLNARELSPAERAGAHRDGKLHLAAEWTAEGDNSLLIAFRNEYSRNGNGLHAFTDADGAFYAYCQTEPYYCCQIFPVFDQPDLKGFLSLYVLAEGTATVVANTASCGRWEAAAFEPVSAFERMFLERHAQDFARPGRALHAFTRSPLLPSYLFAFAVGSYASLACEDGQALPMRLFCRASLLPRAREQSADIFAFARLGVQFYEEFFRTPFPFDKLDLLFGPEYTVGAMEYPGLVTFNDRYLFREQPAAMQVTRRGLTILHELAHMWFGDYVTMRWWNDLWLNESFAEMVCFVALDAVAPRLPCTVADAWTLFAAEKDWGYFEDQMETTHPISGEVPNTSSADSIFDGITYSKGAAALKQLYKRIGREAFCRGLASYFERYKWSNATLTDLLAEMSAAAPALNLEEWNRAWVEAAGLNTVEAQWKPGGATLTLQQGAALPEHATLRHHSLLAAFFDEQGQVSDSFELELLPQKTTVVARPLPAAAAFLPNHDDWGYVKVVLDAHSLDFFRRKLPAVAGPDQLVVLRSLFERVRDGLMDPRGFAEAMLGEFIECAGFQQLQTGLSCLGDALEFVPQAVVTPHAERAFLRVLQQLLLPSPNDRRKNLRMAAIRLMRSHRAAELMCDTLLRAASHGLVFTAEEAWRVLLRATAWGVAPELLARVRVAAEAKGEGDYARYFALALEAATCDARRLAEIGEELMSPARVLSYVDAEYVIQGVCQEALPESRSEALLDLLAERFPAIVKEQAVTVWKTLLGLFEACRDPARALERVRRVLPRLPEQEKGAIRALRKLVSDLERTLRIHNAFFAA